MQALKKSWQIAVDAWWQFLSDDGWAIASHIALSALMSMFPFFIVLTAFAAMMGSRDLADEAARIVLEAWPKEVADPIAGEIHNVLTGEHGSLLTLGVFFALYFASSGIESLRIGLNRAYSVVDTRSFLLLRIESVAYVLVGMLSLLAFSFLIVLAPLIQKTAQRWLPRIELFDQSITLTRYAVASTLLIAALFIVHMWLPAGRRSLRDIYPGIAATLVLWLVAGALFGRYLADYAFTYSFYYAGLASPMIALVFLYVTASIFIYGGELNSEILKAREKRRRSRS